MCKAASFAAVPVGDGKIPDSLRVHVPDHPAAWEALVRAEEALPAAILHHSFRTYLYAKAFLDEQFSQRTSIEAHETSYISPIRTQFSPLHALFVACIFHDLGTSSRFDENPVRFEIDGCGRDGPPASEAPGLLMTSSMTAGSPLLSILRLMCRSD